MVALDALAARAERIADAQVLHLSAATGCVMACDLWGVRAVTWTAEHARCDCAKVPTLRRAKR
jgi:hypothetical protein